MAISAQTADTVTLKDLTRTADGKILKFSSSSRRSMRRRAHNRGILDSEGTRERQIPREWRNAPAPMAGEHLHLQPNPEIEVDHHHLPPLTKALLLRRRLMDPGRLTLDHPPVDTVRALAAHDHATCSLPTLYATVLVPTSIRFTANVVSQWVMANNSLCMNGSTLGLTLSRSSVGR